MSYKILVINPGSTSTKIGVYEGHERLFEKTLRHSADKIAEFDTISAQKDFRKELILEMLEENDFDINDLAAVVGRGGFLRPIPCGTYPVTDEVYHDLSIGLTGQHASNLGGVLAREIGDEVGVPSYIVDPVVVDELQDIARVSGMPELENYCIFHALNQKAVAKRYAKHHGVKYEDLNLIVAHLGGGVSVCAHQKGKCIEANNSLDGNGPFSPERSGSVQVGPLVDMCFSGDYTKEEIRKKITGRGGMTAYLGTNDMLEIEIKAYKEKDPKVKFILDAFIYQVAKEIGSMAAVLKGDVDQILITGGVAYGKPIMDDLKEYISYISDVTIFPGEDEMLALAEGTMRVLTGEEEPMPY